MENKNARRRKGMRKLKKKTYITYWPFQNSNICFIHLFVLSPPPYSAMTMYWGPLWAVLSTFISIVKIPLGLKLLCQWILVVLEYVVLLVLPHLLFLPPVILPLTWSEPFFHQVLCPFQYKNRISQRHNQQRLEGVTACKPSKR